MLAVGMALSAICQMLLNTHYENVVNRVSFRPRCAIVGALYNLYLLKEEAERSGGGTEWQELYDHHGDDGTNWADGYENENIADAQPS